MAAADGIEDDEKGAHGVQILHTDGMPRRLHFDGVEYPVRVLGFRGEPFFFGERAAGVAFEIRGAAGFQNGGGGGISGVHDGVHVHVRGEVRGEFGAGAGEDVHDAAGQVAGGHDFAEGERGERCAFAGEGDAGVAAENRGGGERDEAEQRGRIGAAQRRTISPSLSLYRMVVLYI